MTEDERYRTSTQFRYWSYAPAALLALRTTTNKYAAAQVREAVQRARQARAMSTSTPEGEDGRANSAMPEAEVDCLTVEEELMFVTYSARQLLGLGDHIQLPTEVKATAVQYFKRFYLANSCMTYSPPDILKTALYFATKTENHYYKLTRFAESVPNTAPEDILASEFLLTQGLRFMFDIRHPFRALAGAVMELTAIAQNDIPVLPGVAALPEKPERMAARATEAAAKAKKILDTSALLSDVYFHYTPSQIMMASLMIADSELAEWYLVAKLPPRDPAATALMEKVHKTVVNCAQIIQSVDNIPAPDPALKRKLRKCRNPEKMDLVSLQKAKRLGEDGQDEKIVKKRKLEREQSAKEGEDLFGPEIKKS